jgi:hypothetical protein
MEKNVNAAEVARKAAQIISERGLAKGVLMDLQGQVCHDGAIFLALGVPITGALSADCHFGSPEQEMSIRIRLASREILQHRSGGEPSCDIPYFFNDQDSTSAEDVILLLKEAAEQLEEA